MRDFFEKKLIAFKNDSIIWRSALIASLLFCFHLYQLIDSNFLIQPLIRVIFYALLIPALFLIGRKALPFGFFLFALAIGLTISFDNYTPFLIVALACFLVPKAEILFLSLYALDIIAVCMLHDKSPIHLLIHYINCIFFYSFLKLLIKGRAKREPLILTPEETFILEELRNGKQQKEILTFSKNTVTKKLREARLRNNLATTEELLTRYIASLI